MIFSTTNGADGGGKRVCNCILMVLQLMIMVSEMPVLGEIQNWYTLDEIRIRIEKATPRRVFKTEAKYFLLL
jgi:hypothetical protein